MTYKIQIDDEVRDATEEESSVIAAQQAEILARDEEAVSRAAARESLLIRLGLTAEEAQLLLGGI
jgi:hypothetical protein